MRETVKDRRVSLIPRILPLPQYPSLCESFKGKQSYLEIENDISLYVETLGTGIPLLFVHGGPGSTHHYFHSSFPNAIPGIQMIFYDQRGCGQSDYNKSGLYTIKEAVHDIEKLKSALGIKKWFVLGHSYGGFLAQLYQLWFPQSLEGIILVNASHGLKNQKISRCSTRYLSTEELNRIDEIDSNTKLSLAEKIYNCFKNGDWKRQNYYKPTDAEMYYASTYEWNHDNGFNDVMSEDMKNYPLDGLFTDSKIPTLIIEGKDDPTWDKTKPEKLAANHPGARLLVVPNASHETFFDQSDVFKQTVLEFVNKAQ